MSRMITPKSSKSRADPPTPPSTGSESSAGMPGASFQSYGVPMNSNFPQQQPHIVPGYSSHGFSQQSLQPNPIPPAQLPPTHYQFGPPVQQQQQMHPLQVAHQPASLYTPPLRYSQRPHPQTGPQPNYQQNPYSQQWQAPPQSLQYGTLQSQRFMGHPAMSGPSSLQNMNHQVSYSNLQPPRIFPHDQQQYYSPPPSQLQHPYAPQPAMSSSPLHPAQNIHNQGYALQQSFSSSSSAHQQPLSEQKQQPQPQLLSPRHNPSVQSDPMSLPENVAQRLSPSDAIVNRAFRGNNVNTIDMDAFKNFLSDLGVSQPTDDYFRNLLDHTGALNNGMMTRQVFRCVLPKVVAYSAFARADPGGKGELKPAMFRAALKLLGIELEENRTYYYVGQADRDRDRAIDLEEFVKILPVIAHDENTDFDCMVARFRHAVWKPVQSPVVSESCSFNATPTMASCAFRKVVGEKGWLSLAEFKEALEHMHIGDKTDDLTELFKRADKNGDGRISKKELIGMVNNDIASQSSGPLK